MTSLVITRPSVSPFVQGTTAGNLRAYIDPYGSIWIHIDRYIDSVKRERQIVEFFE